MTDQQELIALTMLFKPIGFLLLLALIYPFKWAATKLPDGKLRRVLLFRITNRHDRG
jgi:hypothetical protein